MLELLSWLLKGIKVGPGGPVNTGGSSEQELDQRDTPSDAALSEPIRRAAGGHKCRTFLLQQSHDAPNLTRGNIYSFFWGCTGYLTQSPEEIGLIFSAKTKIGFHI